MCTFLAVRPYFDPQDIYNHIKDKDQWVEMSPEQHAFLCGLIKENRPQKILEIGTSAGGTTAIILNCCNKLKLNAEVYTIDLLGTCWHDSEKSTGFIVNECSDFLETGGHYYSYRSFRGGIYPEFASDIGDSIDLLVLDTAHSLPGEIMDFLACAPRLSVDAVVVLHDVTLNHSSGAIYNYATKVLFDVVSGEKYWMLDKRRQTGETLSPESISNIAAFKKNDATMRNIMDVFSSLSLTWNYYPGDEQLRKYRELFVGIYDTEYMDVFDNICGMQRDTYDDRLVVNHMGIDAMEAWRSESSVYIYGAGYWGKKYFNYARKYGLSVEGMVISDDNSYNSSWRQYEIPLFHLSEFIEKKHNKSIVVAVDRKSKGEIVCDLMKSGIKNILL